MNSSTTDRFSPLASMSDEKPLAMRRRNDVGFIDLIYAFSIFFVIIQPGIQLFWNFDGAGRSPAIFMVAMFVLMFYNERDFHFPVAIRWWGIWFIYSVVVLLFVGFRLPAWEFFYTFILAYATKFLFALILANFWVKRRRMAQLTVIGGLLTTCLLMWNQCDYDWISDMARIDTVRLNTNELAFYVTTAIFLLLTYYPEFKFSHWRTNAWIILLSVFLMRLASRTSFCVAVLILFINFFVTKKDQPIKWVKTLFLCVIYGTAAYFTHDYILEHTLVGARFSYNQDEINVMEKYVDTDNVFYKLMGGRSIYFVDAERIWKSSPIWGVGCGNFILYSTYGDVCHNEYLAQLSEGGSIGLTLFIIVWGYLLVRLVRRPAYNRRTVMLLCGWSIVFLTGWGIFIKNNICFYIIMAILSAEILINDKKIAALPLASEEQPDRNL